MKQTIFSFLLTLLPLAASADAVEIDGVYYNLLTKVKTAEVTSNPNKYNGAVIIPETVTCNDVSYSVTSIGSEAFSGCSGLTSINIPNSVVNIGEYVFYQCIDLKSIQVADGNSKFDSRNGCNAIIETESNILIAGCKETVIPNSVTSIGNSAFSGCSGLTNITIPSSVISIGDDAFRGCSGLTSITIPNSVISIGIQAFGHCSGLTSIAIPNTVISIGGLAFRKCTSLTSIVIPNSVTYIGSSAFESCSALTSIVIPNSVTSIEYQTFSGCTSLTSVTIPSSVTSIGEYAFTWCNNLLTVNSEILEPFNCSKVFTTNTLRNGTLYIPAGTKDLYTRFDGWREFLKIEEVGGEHEQYVWLTIKDGRGSTMLKVKKGATQELAFKPEAGWKILTATMDGTDISTQIKSGNVYTTPAIMNDATISIIYEMDDPSSIVTARQSKADINVVDDGVVISNAEPQSRCVVYSSSGQQIVNTVIEDGSRKITLQKGQVYILTINGRTLKFAL